MRIAVAVKPAAALEDADAAALDTAATLRDAADAGGEILAVAVGGWEADVVLLDALARGAERAVRIADGRDPRAGPGLDALAVARLLAAAVAREAPDLVLCGAGTDGAGGGATGVALAAHLDLPRVASVRRVERDGERLVVEREVEGGLVEVLRIGLPALLAMQGAGRRRAPTLRAIKRAGDRPRAVLEPAELGLDPAALDGSAAARVLAVAPLAPGRTEMLGGPPAAVAERIAAIVRARTAR